MGWKGHHAGFIVLTLQPDNSWIDDWDGKVHLYEADAVAEVTEARKVLGQDYVRLAELHWFNA